MTEDEMRVFDKEYYSKIAREEGLEEGRLEKEKEMIINLYNNGAALDLISKSSNLSIEEIKKIIEEEK